MSGCEFEFCETCNRPLTLCGQPNPDGEPSLDCHACLLREKIAEKDKRIAEMAVLLDGVRHQGLHRKFVPEFAEAGQDQCTRCAWEKLKAT